MNKKFYILILCLFSMVFRDIDAIKNAIFFAEEGTVFYPRALELGILSFMKPFAGYYQFYQTSILFISTYFDIESAPYVTILFSIITYLIPTLIILFGKSIFNFSTLQKLIICLLIVTCGDGFHYSITSAHFVLSLACYIILFEDLTHINKWKGILYIVLITVSSLSGILTCVMLPFFLFRWWKERNKWLLWIVLFILLAGIVQITFFSISYFGNDPVFKSRFNTVPIDYFFFKYYFQILTSCFIGDYNDINRPIIILCTVYFLYLTFRIKHYQAKTYLWILVVSLLTIGFIADIFSLGLEGGSRYFMISNMGFVILLFAMEKSLDQGKISINLAIVGFLFLASLIQYSQRYYDMRNQMPIIWKNEVAKWKQDPSYALKIYPIVYDKDSCFIWTVKLKREELF